MRKEFEKRMRKLFRRICSLMLAAVLLATTVPVSFAADDGAAFQNGPYLLAPKTTSMVVVWESTQPVGATIAYGTDENNLCEPIAVASDPDAPDFKGAKMNLFHYKLEGLAPGTRYYYEVKLDGGESCKASFRTLSENPAEIRLISLSDSHIFATREELDAAVKEYDPDIILHCGDLVEGTGAQAEQFSFWFQGKVDNDFIHSYPVVYSSGNHDQGGIYFDTYVYSIQDEEYGAAVEGDSSFNYGGLHIITMNSNPWGLFQMNSEATGEQADAATLQTIDDAMAWLKSDLATDAATQADFRIIMMHHPVSDAYTRRYIPSVIEPGKVDLLLSGHTHTYAREVSTDPTVGAGTVYLTHQDARTYNKKGDFFYINYVPGSGVMSVKNYGAAAAGEQSTLANETLIATEKQQLAWSDISITPDSVLYNGDVTVTATVTNIGKGLAAAVIPVQDNGEARYLYEFADGIVTLDPGQSATLTGTLRMESLGTHTLTLADQTATVEVEYRPATFDYTNIRTKQGDGEVSDMDSNVLHIKADVVNIGNDAGTGTAEFKVNGVVKGSKEYSLESGESQTAEFAYIFDKAGEYEVTIGNAEPETIYVEGSIQGMPIVKDKSGNGNDGYIHGQPEFGTDDQGHQTLILDGKRDYIEIPDNGGYTPTDSMTGMVWANLPSAGTTKGGVSELTEQYVDLDGKGAIPDHNPLMVKGIGLGWGTPYMFRMAVRETGKVTYGVCLLDDNGEFSWNDGDDASAGIKKDQWVQYTSAFDFATGGDSYQNEIHSAHVDKPAFENVPIKTWDGEPMYIGLGFKNTIQTLRNRGMYHTMLPGAISQVRFYTSKLSEDEVTAVRENPTEAGASADSLKIWLDFESANIETTGTHTTEWVEATAAPTSLAYDASFAGKASITATVQTSDDGQTVKEEKEAALTSGKGTIDLTGMGQAKYVRVKTTFVSDLNSTESSVPVLNEYTLTAGTVKVWNTLTDWVKGTFEGAAGHQPSHVYRNYAKDFDDFGEVTVAAVADDTPAAPMDTTAPDTADTVSFTDLTGHWAADAAAYVTEKGLFQGTDPGLFSPDEGMSRGMFVTVLGRLAGIDPADYSAASSFTDVDSSAYYSPYVNWAVENKLVTGADDTHFEPDAMLTREQAAVILHNYLTATGAQLTTDDSLPSFSDTDRISEYAKDAVRAIQTAGLMHGKENNCFDPTGTATRADVAVILQNLCQTLGV